MSGVDRRTRIAAAAIDVVAEHGARALTHRAVDQRAGLPAGSTSFYARTRRALVALAVEELAARARSRFDERGLEDPDALVPLDEVAEQVAGFLEASRSGPDLVARYALALEVRHDEELHRALASATFSTARAEGLMRSLGAADPAAAAHGFVALCEGLLLDALVGHGSLAPDRSPEVFRSALTTYLQGLR